MLKAGYNQQELKELRGLSVSSMITLVIPSNYCL